MKKFTIKFSPKGEKDFNKLEAKNKKRVVMALLSLEKDPLIGKKLKGDLAGFYSIRVWPYRIIYTVIKKECVVIIL